MQGTTTQNNRLKRKWQIQTSSQTPSSSLPSETLTTEEARQSVRYHSKVLSLVPPLSRYSLTVVAQ